MSSVLRRASAWIAELRLILASKLAASIYSLYVVQGLNYLLPFLTLPYLLRVLGPSNYGAVAFAQSLTLYGVTLTDFGFNFSATRAISIAREDREELSRIFWTTISAKGILLVIAALLISSLVLASATLREHAGLVAVCGINVVGTVLLPQWYFQGLERMRVMAGIVALSRTAALFGVFVFVHSPQNDLAAAFFLSVPTLLGGVVCLLWVRRIAPVGIYRPRLHDLRGAFASSRDLFLLNVATSTYTTGNGVILGFVSGDRAVALYAMANKAMLAAFYLFMPVVLATFPRASFLFGRSSEEGKRFVRKLSVPLLGAAAIVSILLVIFARKVVYLLGGDRYIEAVPVLRVMGAVPFLMTLATVLGQIVMINLGLGKTLSRIYLAMGALSLMLLPELGEKLGGLGGALCLLIIESLGPALMLLALRRAQYFNVKVC